MIRFVWINEVCVMLGNDVQDEALAVWPKQLLKMQLQIQCEHMCIMHMCVQEHALVPVLCPLLIQ